jgi:hypothetical protein
MRRREFLALAAVMASFPSVAQAQPTQVRKIGFLGNASPADRKPWSKMTQSGHSESRIVAAQYNA